MSCVRTEFNVKKTAKTDQITGITNSQKDVTMVYWQKCTKKIQPCRHMKILNTTKFPEVSLLYLWATT